MEKDCTHCKPSVCPLCQGWGEVRDPNRAAGLQGSYQTDKKVVCPACTGTGVVWPPCSEGC